MSEIHAKDKRYGATNVQQGKCSGFYNKRFINTIVRCELF